MNIDQTKRDICVAVGVECPDWLRKITDEAMLDEIRNLVNAGVLLVAPDSPELSPIISNHDLVRYGARAAMIIDILGPS